MSHPIDDALGVTLPDDLRVEALTHRSYAAEHPGTSDNKRLEFLGDKVLGLVVADECCRRFPDANEGVLTQQFITEVRNRRLAAIGAAIGVVDHMRVGAGVAASGEAAADRVLAGAVEAIIGAVYSALGLEDARGVVLRLLRCA